MQKKDTKKCRETFFFCLSPGLSNKNRIDSHWWHRRIILIRFKVLFLSCGRFGPTDLIVNCIVCVIVRFSGCCTIDMLSLSWLFDNVDWSTAVMPIWYYFYHYIWLFLLETYASYFAMRWNYPSIVLLLSEMKLKEPVRWFSWWQLTIFFFCCLLLFAYRHTALVYISSNETLPLLVLSFAIICARAENEFYNIMIYDYKHAETEKREINVVIAANNKQRPLHNC